MLFEHNGHIPPPVDRGSLHNTATGSVPRSYIAATSHQLCEETLELLRSAVADFWRRHHYYLDISVPFSRMSDDHNALLSQCAAIGYPPIDNLELKLRMGGQQISMTVTIKQPGAVDVDIRRSNCGIPIWSWPPARLSSLQWLAASGDVPLWLLAEPSSLDVYNILRALCMVYDLPIAARADAEVGGPAQTMGRTAGRADRSYSGSATESLRRYMSTTSTT